MARVFISHSSADKAAANDMIGWLKDQGFEEVFLDFDHHHGIPPGEDWERRLYSEIQLASAVVLLLTKNWFESKWCFVEFTQARALGKSVLPVVVTPDGNQFIGDSLQKISLVSDRSEGLARLLHRLRDISLEGPTGFNLPKGRPPYPGLMSFDRDDAAVFFGRGPELRETLQQLERLHRCGGASILHLHGESGSGKSSLLKAGLLPLLERRSGDWLVLPTFRPGAFPLRELRAALRSALDGHATAEVDALLTSPTPDGAGSVIDALQQRSGQFQASVLISIDQFEEAFTLPAAHERRQFIEVLSALLSPQFKSLAIATLRSADLPRVVATLALPGEERVIGPVSLDRLPEIIRRPAQVAGMQVDDELVAALGRDASTADAMPLVAFLLRQLYDRHGADHRLTLAEYESLGDAAAGLRPLETCVRDAADQAIKRVSPPPEDLAALREAFVPGLVRLDDEGQFTRRPLPASELPTAATRLIAALVDERLLVRRDDGAIEVAHEALYRVWPLLHGWLEEEKEFLLGKSRIEAAYADWRKAEAAGHGDDALLTGLLLSRAETWYGENPRRFSADEQALIDRSIDARETAILRKRETARRLLISTVAAAVIFALLGGVAWVQRNAAEKARQEETRAKNYAIAARDNEAKAKNDAIDARNKEEAERKRSEAEADRARRSDYANRIALAQTYLQRANMSRVRALLDACPTELRHYEWYRLRYMMDVSVASLRGPTYVALGGLEFVPGFFAVSADGRRIAFASGDTTLDVWDAEKGGEVLLTLRGHENWVKSVAFSTDGNRIVSGSVDKTIKVWDAEKGGDAQLTLRGHEEGVTAVAISNDGNRIVSGSVDTTIKVWDAEKGGDAQLTLRGHEEGVTAVAVSVDGNRIVSASVDKTLKVWDARKGGDALLTLGPHWADYVAISADGERIVSGGNDGTLKVWDAEAGGDAILTLRHENFSSIAVSADGKRIVSASSGPRGSFADFAERGTIRVWDAEKGAEGLLTLRGHENWSNTVTLSADGKLIVAGSSNSLLTPGEIKVWSVEKGGDPVLTLRGHQGVIIDVVLIANQTRIASLAYIQDWENGGGIYTREVKVWDMQRGGDGVLTLRHDNRPSAVISADGRRIISASSDKVLKVWDAEKGGDALFTLRGHEKSVRSVAVSADGQRIVSASYDGTIKIWDAEKGGAALITLPCEIPYSVAIGADGNRIVFASDYKTLNVWDAKKGGNALQFVLPVDEGRIGSVFLSADGKRIVTENSIDRRDDKGEVRVWDAEKGGEALFISRGDDGFFHVVGVSADGKRILLHDMNGRIQVWDTEKGVEAPITLRGPESPIGLSDLNDWLTPVALSSDGRRIVAGHPNYIASTGEIHVWDAERGGDPLLTLRGHEGPIISVAISADGKRIVSCSSDRTIKVWDAYPRNQP